METVRSFRPGVIGLAGMYLGLAAVVFFFAFCNLDGRLFWGDEAETALLARNVLKFGVPKVDDGVNHISLHGDSLDARDGMWTWSPWLPDYLTAASFAVFGTNTWAGRAPFAFIGWLAVVLLGLTAWKIYRSHRIALASMLLLGTSEVFLLHIRQCRYYSVTVLAEIGLVYGLYQIVAYRRRGSWWILAGLLVLFYCNYTSAVANVPVLLLAGLRLYRKKSSALRAYLLSLGIWLVLSASWLVFAETWRQEGAELHQSAGHILWFYAWQFHFHFLPWCFLLLPLGGWLFHRLSKTAKPSDPWPGALPDFEKYLLLLMALYVPVLFVMPEAFSRYLLPLLPVACLLAAAWLFRYIRWTVVAVVILAFQCLTNVFAVATDPFGRQYPVRSPLADFVFSSLLPYEDRLTDLLAFFGKNARPGDVVVSWDPEFPLAFYTRLKIVDARLRPIPREPLPRWILPESATGDLNEKHDELPPDSRGHYEKIIVAVHGSTPADNIPEPDAYELETAKTKVPFILYELKDGRRPPVRNASAH